MQFSRAVAIACFTVLKWLSIIASVLFAALAFRFQVDGDTGRPVMGALAASMGSLFCAYVLHVLAKRIQG